MNNKQQHQIALTCAVLLGGFHLLWAALVFTGMAQGIMDFIFWAHMIHLPITVGPFEMTAAITLVVVTASIGYALGYVGAIVWHKVHH